MCLGIPGKVIMMNNENKTSLVDSFGTPFWVGNILVPDIEVDDYVLVHAGHALEKIDIHKAGERIGLWEELLDEENKK